VHALELGLGAGLESGKTGELSGRIPIPWRQTARRAKELAMLI
jgi:hypothetical protein